MNTSEFDNLLRDRFSDGEFEYKPAQWDRMVIELNTVHKKKNRILPLLGMAAAIAAVAITSGLWLLRKPAAPIAATKSAAEQAKTPVLPVAASQEDRGREEQEMNTPAASVDNIAPHSSHAVPRHMDAYNNPVPVQQPSINTVGDTAMPVAAANKASEKQTGEKPRKNYDKVDLSLPVAVYTDEAKDKKRLSVGVTGGVNYSSASSGYMAGVNARQPLGRKLYLEGDLAVISSKNLQNTANYSATEYSALNAYHSGDHSGGFTGSGSGQPVGNTSAPPKGQAVSNLYYLQVAPTLGYQLIRKISVGVGADFQRKLQADETKTVVSDNPQTDDIKLAPNMDIGLTGKAEYSITKKLKAGVLYRGGVNSWMDPKYVNRNYMQVQLKWMIFGTKH